jgi:flavodoxin I
MKILIIYDSLFGSTEKITLSMVHSIQKYCCVEFHKVKEVKAEHLKNTKLLIVGSPTRSFKPTPDISIFLATLPARSLKGIRVAAFDTRIALSSIKSRLFRYIVRAGGYAAQPISEWLIKKGGNLVLPPEGFLVSGDEGPLETGEKERAADWIKSLLKRIEFSV